MAKTVQRVAIFAAYNPGGLVQPHIPHYLAKLSEVAPRVVYVSDNELDESEIAKLRPYVSHAICARHEEYDFGFYKRGMRHARAQGLLERADELILCDDSCVGPIGGFAPMFDAMAVRLCDFWGVTDSDEFGYHLQSYFLCLRRPAFCSEALRGFLDDVKPEESVRNVVLNYGVKLTQTLQEAGLTPGCFIEDRPLPGPEKASAHILQYPLFMIAHGSPLVKVKALKRPECNLDGMVETLRTIRSRDDALYAAVVQDPAIAALEACGEVAFSIVMATRNRAHCLGEAIRSVLAQRHRNFELIIVDDASTDDTEGVVKREFEEALAEERLLYIKLTSHAGVSRARNVGLSLARNPWIAYADSDNILRPHFLSTFAAAIVQHPATSTFYARFCRTRDGVIGGADYDRARLLKRNFIDLGVFVHRRTCFDQAGGLDPTLKRLVDWDLILRYTERNEPVHIPQIVLDYVDAEDPDRISRRESWALANVQVTRKHSNRPTISTFVPTYNHEMHLRQAIESALMQKGDFAHEIVLSDDGSSDTTASIVDEYCHRYPSLVRSVGSASNRGISETYRSGFLACAGEFIAILEGDDYWTDEHKLEAQSAFLAANPDCPMVFSRVLLKNSRNDTWRTLTRQDGIKTGKLAAEDFLRHESMNLIVNFSTCMFRAAAIQSLPRKLYEERLSEIAVAFYFDRLGKIGFINKVMSVYQQHSGGVWTGSSRMEQLRSALAIRRIVHEIARPELRPTIALIIETRYERVIEEMTTSASASTEPRRTSLKSLNVALA